MRHRDGSSSAFDHEPNQTPATGVWCSVLEFDSSESVVGKGLRTESRVMIVREPIAHDTEKKEEEP